MQQNIDPEKCECTDGHHVPPLLLAKAYAQTMQTLVADGFRCTRNITFLHMFYLHKAVDSLISHQPSTKY